MTLLPLFEYIANHFLTTVSLYDLNLVQTMWYSPKDACDTLSIPPVVQQFLLKETVSGYPQFTFTRNKICYIHFLIPDGTVIIGPLRMLFTETVTHAKHIIDLEVSQESIQGVYPPHIFNLILVLFNCSWSTNFTLTECLQKNFNTTHIPEEVNRKTTYDIFSNRENQKMHNPYTQELRLLKSIEDGNIEMLQDVWKETTTENLGTTASDPVRNGKNMAIYNITACGRAAIRAGISAEYIFSLTDSYSQQIEELKNLLLLQSLVEEAELHFAQLVKEYNSQKRTNDLHETPLIQRCKDYIFKHLHEPLTVQQVARELQIHPNYLSSLFHKQEGQSLYQYILAEKMNLTKNLLIYSDYSYLEIAHYLGFLSQSHLGTRFKAMTGMTLKQYREANKNKDF